MELNKLNVDELTEFSVPKDMHNSDQLYIQEKKLYKLFRNNSFILEKERNVDFLINHRIPNTPVIYEKLYACANPDAVLVTYCAKGAVRRGLQAAGFEMERLPGPPGKRHILRGRKRVTSVREPQFPATPCLP